MDFAQAFVIGLTIASINIFNVESLFQGFNIRKEFDVSLKPFVFKPISFIKEKFSPFGRFGVKHGIQKRAVGALEPAPVTEHALHIEPAVPVGPFLTPAFKPKQENLFFPPESVTVKSFLLPESSNSGLPLITLPDNNPVTSFRPGTSHLLPSFVSFQSTQRPEVLITPAPIFQPELQGTLEPVLKQELTNSPPLINTNTLIAQSDIPADSWDQSLISNLVSPIPSPRPFSFLFNNPPSAMPPITASDSEVVFLNSIPYSSKLRPMQQVSTPLSNTVFDATLPIPPAFINEVLSQDESGDEKGQSSGLNTDIGRAELINNYLNLVKQQPNVTKPDVKDIPSLPNNSFVPNTPNNNLFSGNSALMRGTKMALYFSNIFVQLMSQFFSNARLTLNQLPELRLRE